MSIVDVDCDEDNLKWFWQTLKSNDSAVFMPKCAIVPKDKLCKKKTPSNGY